LKAKVFKIYFKYKKLPRNVEFSVTNKANKKWKITKLAKKYIL